MTVPYTFASATTTLPLSQLDANFAAVGNTVNITYTAPFTGAVSETVQSKLAQSVNVKDFGAVGNGIADDTTAIQAAINSGATVYFGGPSDTYKITSTLDISNGDINLIGNGATIDATGITSGNKWAMKAVGGLAATTTLLTADASNQTYSITVTSATGFSVNDWVLLSSNDPYTQYSNASYVVYAGEFLCIRSIVGTTITFTTPIVSAPTQYTTANSAKITKTAFVENISISGLNFLGSNIAGQGERGLVLQYVKNFNVENCNFTHQDIYQLEVTMSIIGNIVNNTFYGVFYDGTTGTIFYGLVFLDSSQYVNAGDNIFQQVRHAVTTSSKSNGQGGWGQPLYINVHHNQMFDAQAGGAGRSWGFEQHGFGQYISFNNNMVNGCYGGINVDAGFNIEILNNVFTNIWFVGIQIGSTAVNVSNIFCSGNTVSMETNETAQITYGILLNNTTGYANSIILNNNFISNINGLNSYGVYIQSSPTNINISIQGNNIIAGESGQDSDSAYAIASNAAEATIANNICTNYRQGIYNFGTYSLIKGNTVRYTSNASSGYGIYTIGSNSIIDGNVLIRPYSAIFIAATTSNAVVTNNVIKNYVSAGLTDNGTGTTKVNNN